ncbi:MAG: O-antigen ligase family protein [Candidatus Moraniibacteriota bacterium]
MIQSPFFRDAKRAETFAFTFLIILLSVDAAVNAVAGFSLPIFLATVIPAAFLAFLYPRSGLAASLVTAILFERFFTLMPLTVGETTYKLYPLDLILAPVFLSAFLLFVRDGRLRFRFVTVDRLLLLFFGIVTAVFIVGLIGLGKDQGLATAFSTWKNYVFYGMLYFATAVLVRSWKDVWMVAKIFLSAVATAGIFLLIGIVRGGGLWTEYTPLSTPGTRFLAFPHAFYYSLGLIVVLLFLPYMSYRTEDRDTENESSRWRYTFVLILSAGIILSLMRHLWIGIAVTFTLAMLLSPKLIGKTLVRFTLKLALPLVTVLILALAIISSIPENLIGNPIGNAFSIIRERVLSIGSGTDESLAWREAVWGSALSRFSEHPLSGIGFGASVPVELGDYRQYVEVRDMHNSWLALLIQTGIFGATAFATFLVSLVAKLLRSSSQIPFFNGAKTVLLGLLLFQGMVFFSQPYLETNLLGMFFWMTLGLARALPDMADEVAR